MPDAEASFSRCRMPKHRSPKQCSLLPSVIAMHFAKHTKYASEQICKHAYFACPLDHRARRVLGLFAKGDLLLSSDVANLLGISTRHARELLLKWSGRDWLEIADPSRRGWKYRLTKTYKSLVA